MGDGGGRSIDEFCSSSTGIILILLLLLLLLLIIIIGTNTNNKNTMHDTKTQRYVVLLLSKPEEIGRARRPEIDFGASTPLRLGVGGRADGAGERQAHLERGRRDADRLIKVAVEHLLGHQAGGQGVGDRAGLQGRLLLGLGQAHLVLGELGRAGHDEAVAEPLGPLRARRHLATTRGEKTTE